VLVQVGGSGGVGRSGFGLTDAGITQVKRGLDIELLFESLSYQLVANGSTTSSPEIFLKFIDIPGNNCKPMNHGSSGNNGIAEFYFLGLFQRNCL
jgi:hypothetical protein